MRHAIGMDRLIALGCILGGSVYLSASFSIAQADFGDPMGPRLFPQILGSLLILLSIIMMLSTFSGDAPSGENHPAGAMPFRTLLAIGLCAATVIAFVLLLPVIGFPMSAFMVIGSFLLILREPMRPTLIWAAGLTALFYVVFVVLLQTPFPDSILGGIFQ